MARKDEPRIVKTTGVKEPFDERKLRSSMSRAGAGKRDQDRVVQEVRKHLRDGMTTRRLYRIAFQVLRKGTKPAAARYSLQRAILELGPSGYPFEQFMGELMRHEGWKTRVGVHLKGRYVSHEVDIEARQDGRRVLGECKFRVQADGKVDVREALYVYGRSQDLKGVQGGYTEFWLVTNGRFTEDARRLGEGMGLFLLSWNHPRGDGLRERIDRAGLHPVTCLTHLRKKEKAQLLREGTVVVADLHDRPRLLEKIGLSKNRLGKVRSEVDGLCGE